MIWMAFVLIGGAMLVSGSIPIRFGSVGGNWLTRIAGLLFIVFGLSRFILGRHNHPMVLVILGVLALVFFVAGVIKELSPPVR